MRLPCKKRCNSGDYPASDRFPLLSHTRASPLEEDAYRIDLLVGEEVVVELNTVEALLLIHQAQLHTYMKLSNHSLGLLINFNAPLLKQGIKRHVINFPR